MSMLRSSPTDGYFLTRTDWNGYLTYLDLLEGQHVKITYDRGNLELLSPSPLDEQIKKMIGALLECLMEEMGIDGQGGGSTTFRRKALDQGIEPDECYWIRSMTEALKRHADPERVPAPDLAIEVEVSHSSLNRLGIYAGLGVGEVWRWIAEGETHIRIHVMSQPGIYEEVPSSRLFPTLPLATFEQHVLLGVEAGQISTVRQFRAWVKANLPSS